MERLSGFDVGSCFDYADASEVVLTLLVCGADSAEDEKSCATGEVEDVSLKIDVDRFGTLQFESSVAFQSNISILESLEDVLGYFLTA